MVCDRRLIGWGLWLRVWELAIEVRDSGFGVDTLGPYNLSICRVLGSGCRMFGFRFLVLVLGLRTLKHLRASSGGLYLIGKIPLEGLLWKLCTSLCTSELGGRKHIPLP